MANIPPIFLRPNYEGHAFTSKVFPGGEQHFRWNAEALKNEATITVQMQRFDFPLLAVAIDALRRMRPDIDVQLYLPYFPAARQDRVCNEGEALSAKVYADMVNSLGFKKVIINDPHSNVITALIDNVKVVPHGTVLVEAEEVNVLEFLLKREEERFVRVFAPDKGATEKVRAAIGALPEELQERVIFEQGDKVRDTMTGKLEGFDATFDPVHKEKNLPCIIMDDINCNGGTFLGLASVLKERGANSITLFTTHSDHDTGIENILDSEHIDYVVTTDSQGPFGDIFEGRPDFHCFNVFI